MQNLVSTLRQTETVNTVLVDEDTVVLESLPQALLQYGPAKIVGRAVDLKNGLQICQALNPQILLVEDRCFRADCRLLLDYLPIRMGRLKLALLADRMTDIECNQAIAMKAAGFFSKRDAVRDLSQGLSTIAAGERHVSRNLADRIQIDTDTGEFRLPMDSSVSSLTALQLQVLVHLANGMRVREVAGKMHLTPKAIESHKYRIMQRLGVRDRLGLCRWAIREGLIEP